MLLKCLNCGTKLSVSEEKCSCPECLAEWPIVGGIPRFFQMPSYYWGEVGRDKAGELLDAARKESWAKAVQAHFPNDENMRLSLLDLQRASWAPMLGLDERSVALDVGCGYGAITHSISRLVGELYSIEAIPERIEFTQERLRQEGIYNVRLIQASATALPLVEKSFDLVVTNGVLEWVGEWDTRDDPRHAQLKFLSTIRRLLKDGGVLVIGIENRFGYPLFLGECDHSGIPYTSLVPRCVASFMLRHSSVPHHRTRLNPQREYRTFTYSERGYRKLLKEAGFANVSCHWAEPGYNQPYYLTPLAVPHWISEQFLELLDHPAPSSQKGWRRWLKRSLAFSGILHLVLPEFVFVASHGMSRRTRFQSWLQGRLESVTKIGAGATGPQGTVWALYTHPFAQKSVVRLGDPKSGRESAFVKVEVGDRNGVVKLEAELANSAKIRDILRSGGSLSVGVPLELGKLRVGNVLYSLESTAQGTKLSRLVHLPGYYRNSGQVEKDFARVVHGVIELTKALWNVSGLRNIHSGWREIPEELNSSPEMRVRIEEVRYPRNSSVGSHATWIQHGDLSVENVFFDPETGRIEVLDWADLAGGFPPLYDLFSLLHSTGYLSPRDEAPIFASEEDRWVASFKAIFFDDSRFAQNVKKLILHACERLEVRTELIPALLAEFLIVRSHYYLRRSLVQHRAHVRMLQLYAEQNGSVFGRFQMGHPSPRLSDCETS
jgi:ubiquinone/menaquinone biosynthesis C-methylase UbiE